MDVILSQFSASELRGKCLSAVQGELQHAETQLQPALTALKRALSVVQASRKMHRPSLALVDESPDVSRALETLVAACNEMGALVCEISRHVSSTEGGDASSSATDDEEPKTLRAEPKSDVNEAVVEKKKAAKETLGRIKESTVETRGPPTSSAAIIDLSLSDDDKVVKDEPRVKEEKKRSPKAAVAPGKGGEVEPRQLKAVKQVSTATVSDSSRDQQTRKRKSEDQHQRRQTRPNAVSADVVGGLKVQIQQKLDEIEDWSISYDDFTEEDFDKCAAFIKTILGTQYGNWDPHADPHLGRLVAKVEHLCSFQGGDAWNGRYITICSLCSKMDSSTFVWTVDLTSELENWTSRSAVGEEGFESNERVEADFYYVTSYEDEARQTIDAAAKLSAFEELVDRLQWIFTAVLLTSNQSLVPLERLKRLNLCFATLALLCDKGKALNLEGCIHLEKLVFSVRRLMYVRMDYAETSKRYAFWLRLYSDAVFTGVIYCFTRAPHSLLKLFSPAKRPKFVYPSDFWFSPGNSP